MTDTSGTQTIPTTVVGLQGRPVAATAPAANQVLQFSGTQWQPATIAAGGLTIPNSPLLGGTGTGFSSVAVGTGLSLTGGTLNATGGGTGTITGVTAGTGLTGGGTTGTVTVGLSVPVQVANGGTGSALAATGLANLGGAPLASPNFTGTPLAPTAPAATNTTQIATTAYVKSQNYLTAAVTSITFSSPLTGGTITGTGTVGLGNIPVGNLNSGTGASATTFWRGDGTWAAPAGGGNVTTGTLTANALTVGTGVTAIGSLASLGTTTTVLHGNAAGLPTFGAVNLASDVTGNLPVGNLAGGSGATATTFWRGDGTWATPAGAGGITGTLTNNQLVLGSGASTVTALPPGTSGYLLQSAGAGAPPVWASVATGGGTVNTGTANQLAYYNASTNVVSGNTHITENGSETLVNYSSTMTTPPTYGTPPRLLVTGVDNGYPNIVALGFGTNYYGGFISSAAGGTGNAPAAVASGSQIGALDFAGYDGSSLVASGGVRGYSTELFNSTTPAHGTRLDVFTTQTGSNTHITVAGFENDGGVTVPPSAGSMGAGTINVAGALYVGGVPALAAPGSVEVVQFAGPASFYGVRSDGSAGSPLPLANGDPIGSISWSGRATTTTWGANATGQLIATATQAWSATAQGTSLSLHTTPNNAIAPIVSVLVQNGVQVGSPTSGDMGQGTVNAANYYVNGVALSVVGVDVTTFGAVGDNVHDDTTAIQNAINSLPASGGVVLFPPNKTYLISAALTIGNGSTTAASTSTGVYLRGMQEASPSMPVYGFSYAGSPVIHQSATASAVQINGPLQGWGVQDLVLNGPGTTASIGIHVVSGDYGDCRNLSILNFGTGISSSTVASLPAGITVANSMHCTYRNIHIVTANTNPNFGVLLSNANSTVNANTCFNTLDNLFVVGNYGVGNTTYGIYLQCCDDNLIANYHWAPGTNTGGSVAAIMFDYSVRGAVWPAGNTFNHLDVGTAPIINGGTPSGATANYIRNLSETNGGAYPNLANLVTDYRIPGPSGIVVGAPAGGTSGDMGSGTLNATGLYVGGSAVGMPGSGCVSASWLAGANPQGGTIFVNNTGRTLTVQAITGVPEVLAGAAATVDVYSAASGTAIAGSTKISTSSLNANVNAGTTQSMLSASTTLLNGSRLLMQTTGAWTASVGSVTVYLM